MELLRKENVQIVEIAKDWKDAIRIATEPLEKGGYVEPRYKDEIISNVESMGPYIVLAPFVALPHARPEQGVIKTQIAVTLFRNEVKFDGKETPVKLFITLAAADSDSHLEALMKISELLQEDENEEDNVKKIMNAKDVEELYQYFV